MESAADAAAISTARSRPGRRLVLLGCALLGVALVLWIAAATLVAYRIHHPPFLEYGRTDVYGPHVPEGESGPSDPRAAFGADFESLTVAVGGGKTVAGWFIKGGNSAAILLVPPVGGKRRQMLPYAKFLSQAGYPVMAIDSGDDASTGTSWGWSERMGVLSAASELRRRGFTRIGALGVSEGGAEIIMVQAVGASFSAIVSDSAYSSLVGMFRQVPSIAGLNPALERTALWEAGLFLGHSILKIEPEAAARSIGEAALMVIHNRGDRIVPVWQAEAIAQAAGSGAELWIVEGGGHGDAVFEHPEKYANRVLGFFAKNLQAGTPAGPRDTAGRTHGGARPAARAGRAAGRGNLTFSEGSYRRAACP